MSLYRERLSYVTNAPELLEKFWGMRGADVKPLGRGMNSETWVAEHQGSTYVVKRVPSTRVAGLIVAAGHAETPERITALRPVSAG